MPMTKGATKIIKRGLKDGSHEARDPEKPEGKSRPTCPSGERIHFEEGRAIARERQVRQHHEGCEENPHPLLNRQVDRRTASALC